MVANRIENATQIYVRRRRLSGVRRTHCGAAERRPPFCARGPRRRPRACGVGCN